MPDNETPKHNPWEQWRQKPTDIDLAEVHRFYEKYAPIYYEKSTGLGWSSEDIRREIEKEYNTSDLAITAQVAISRGKEPVVAIPFTVSDPIDIIFAVSQTLDLTEKDKHFYAQIEVPGREEKIEARILSIHTKVPSTNHVVISKALKEQLGVQDGETIRIVNVYQDLSTLDLDAEL